MGTFGVTGRNQADQQLAEAFQATGAWGPVWRKTRPRGFFGRKSLKGWAKLPVFVAGSKNGDKEFLALLPPRLMFCRFQAEWLGGDKLKDVLMRDHIVEIPLHMVMAYRTAMLLRGLCLVFQENTSVAEVWSPWVLVSGEKIRTLKPLGKRQSDGSARRPRDRVTGGDRRRPVNMTFLSRLLEQSRRSCSIVQEMLIGALTHAAGRFPAVLLAVSVAAAPATCWVNGFSREFCCNERHGKEGNPACWDSVFQFDPCCTRPEPEHDAEGGHDAINSGLLVALERKVDAILADGASLESFEGDLRRTISSPEDRSTSVPTARALLAVVLGRLGRREEAEQELALAAREPAARLRVAPQASQDLAIAPSGAWVGTEAAGYHMHDRPLADALITFFQSREAVSVGDFGCGLGLYVRDMRAAGLRAGGFDGNPATWEITDGRCLQADLSRHLDLGTRWDWVLSLEVAEHIPRQFETLFLENLVRHTCSGMVLSWGNQAGEGHVNLRTSEEVEAMLANYGFQSLRAATAELRALATLPWLQSTVLVFQRPRLRSLGC
ncbi:unnamed protein product [Effrenium voratum]|uniref:Uncharacterized protein n=1 Tax=Effrenium voratum TaxID=2562239 RepID=A0AA36I9M8_9DINO|nr:unnamed protein product [Effrenium voratum]